MAYPKDSGATFSGSSGQLAVMAELLQRKCNTAIPVVDVGTDVFAFRDDRKEIARIQVKTEVGEPYAKGDGYSSKFGIPMKQLKQSDLPQFHYILAVRLSEGWGCFLVIGREQLREYWDSGMGYENRASGHLELHVQFRLEPDRNDNSNRLRGMTAICGKFDITKHVDAWEDLPPLRPPVPIDTDPEVSDVTPE